MPHDINSQQSFDALSLKSNGQIKNMGAHDRIPPDPAISRHESPSGVRRRSLPKYATATRTMKTGRFSSGRERNLRTATIIRSKPAAPTPPARSRGEKWSCPSPKKPARTKHVAAAAAGLERIQAAARCSRRPPWHLRVSATEEILGFAPQRRHHGTSSST
jgi:hypothetical protein